MCPWPKYRCGNNRFARDMKTPRGEAAAAFPFVL